MSSQQSLSALFEQALAAESWDQIEELWLAALVEDPIPTVELLEVRRRLFGAGNRSLALTLLELLADALEERKDHDAAVAALREMVRLADASRPELVERLESSFAAARSDCPSLARVIDRFELQKVRKPLETLDIMERWLDHDCGTIVEVVGQGVGRVTDINLELETIKVDVGGRRPVSVPIGAVSRYLRRLPADDLRRRAIEDPDAVRQLLEASPGDAFVQLLESLGAQVDVAAVRAALDGLLPEKAWTGWWSKARSHPRVVTAGSGSRLRYSVGASAESAIDAILEELRNADARDRLAVYRRLVGRGPEAAAEAQAILAASLPGIEGSDPGLAWETAGALLEVSGDAPGAAECRRRLAAEVSPLRLLSGIQDRSARTDALEAIRSGRHDQWVEVWAEWLLHEEHPVVLSTIAHVLDSAGGSEILNATLEAVFRGHTEHPAQFVWACEMMVEAGPPEPIRQRMTPSLLEKLPDTLSRREFGPLRARAKALLDGGQVAVRLLLEQASEQQADRFVKRIGRVSTVEPQRLRLLEQAAHQARPEARGTDAVLFVASRAAVEAKRAELKQLVDVEIPQTLKGIQAAAAEGDLRENFEYHMLRDRQELQSAKAAALQRDLARVKIVEPGTADTSRVNVGTVVHPVDANGGQLPPITILGAWDADVDRRVFASGSELAQRLIGRRAGDTVEIDGVPLTIRTITAWDGGA